MAGTQRVSPCAAAAAVLLLAATLLLLLPAAAAQTDGVAPEVLDPKTVPKYVADLPIPPVMEQVGGRRATAPPSEQTTCIYA
jgi:hypothetical protein